MSLSNVIDSLISRQRWDWQLSDAQLSEEEKHQLWFDCVIKYHVNYMKRQLRNKDNIIENEWKVGFFNTFNRYVRRFYNVELDKNKLYYKMHESLGDSKEPMLYIK